MLRYIVISKRQHSASCRTFPAFASVNEVPYIPCSIQTLKWCVCVYTGNMQFVAV